MAVRLERPLLLLFGKFFGERVIYKDDVVSFGGGEMNNPDNPILHFYESQPKGVRNREVVVVFPVQPNKKSRRMRFWEAVGDGVSTSLATVVLKR